MSRHWAKGKLLIFGLLLMFSGTALLSAQEVETFQSGKDGFVEGAFSGGRVLGQAHRFGEEKDYFTVELLNAYRVRPGTADAYARAYNYPYLGWGLGIESFHQVEVPSSYLKDVYTLYFLTKRDLLRRNYLSLGYTVQAGLAFSGARYDPIENPWNLFFTSFLNYHLATGCYFTVTPSKHWRISLEARLKHHSNGRTSLPNRGVNTAEVGMSVGYAFGLPVRTARRQGKLDEEVLNPEWKKWNYHVLLSGGYEQTLADWLAYNFYVRDPHEKAKEFNKYSRFSLGLDAMYRYGLKAASGLGVELFYFGGMKELKEADLILHGAEEVAAGPGYHNLAVGLAFVQEFYYKNISLALALGAYPYRKMGIHSPTSWNYQRAGIRWYIPGTKGFFVSYSVKANDFQKSEYMEMSLGLRFGYTPERS